MAKKIDIQVKESDIALRRNKIIMMITFILSLAWMIFHFWYLKYIPGFWITYHLGSLFEYLIPAILASSIFYYVLNWLPEYKRERNIANIVFLYSGDKLFGPLFRVSSYRKEWVYF